MASNPTLLLNHLQIQQRIERLAYQIYEDNFDQEELIIAGIINSGFVFAEKLCSALKNICPFTYPTYQAGSRQRKSHKST